MSLGSIQPMRTCRERSSEREGASSNSESEGAREDFVQAAWTCIARLRCRCRHIPSFAFHFSANAHVAPVYSGFYEQSGLSRRLFLASAS